MTSPLSSAPLPPTTPRRRLPFPRTLRQWLLASGILLLLLVVISYLLMRTTPSWYVPLDPTNQHVIDLMERAQNTFDLRRDAKLHNTLESVPLGEQSWSISQDEINAMIAARRGSLPVSSPLVIFTPGKITVAARSKRIPGNDPAGGVGSVVLTIRTLPAESPSDAPMSVIKIHSAWLGCLPVPKSFVENRLPSLAPSVIAATRQELSLQVGKSPRLDKIEGTLTAILQGEPFPVRFTYDGRPIVVKEIRVEDGLLTIVFAPPTPAAVPPRPLPSPSGR